MDYSFLKPYKVNEISSDCITVFEPKKRITFLFVFFRIFPVLMIVSVILLLCLFNFPAKIKLLLSVLPILFLILFFKKYILNIEFSNYSIKIKYQKFIRTEIKEILVSEIENFELESYYISRGGGYFYFVKLKNNNNKIPLLTIPFLYMNEENKSKINEFLKNITGKEILK